MVAASALAKVGARDEATTDRLLALLDSNDREVQIAAAQALGKLADKDDRAVILRLTTMLRSRDELIMLTACESLAQIAPNLPASHQAISECLNTGNQRIVADTCRIAESMKSAAAPVTNDLIRLLASGDAIAAGLGGNSISLLAGNALAAVGKPAIASLITALADESPQVRGTAAEALGRIGPEAEPAVDRLIELLGDDSEYTSQMGCMRFQPQVRTQAARALGRIGPAAAAALPLLILLLEDESLCDVAATAIGGIGPQARSALPDLLRHQTKQSSKMDLATAVYSIDPDHPKVVEMLDRFLQALPFEDPQVVDLDGSMATAVNLLIAIGPRSERFRPVLGNLATTVEHISRDTRGEAAYALARLEPHNGKWRNILVQLASHAFEDGLKDRLKQLDAAGK
jgi:HEAT repeat protein